MAKLYTVITSLDCANTPMDTPEPPRRHKAVVRSHMTNHITNSRHQGNKELKEVKTGATGKSPSRSGKSPAPQSQSSSANMAGCTGCSSTEVAGHNWSNGKKKERSGKSGKRPSDSKGHSQKGSTPFVQLTNGNSQGRRSNQSNRNKSGHSRRRVTLVSMKPNSKRSSSSLSILASVNQSNNPHPRRAHSCGSLLDSAGQEDRQTISDDERLEQALGSVSYFLDSISELFSPCVIITNRVHSACVF